MVLRNGHRLKTTKVLFNGGNIIFKVIGVEYVCMWKEKVYDK